MTHWQAVNEVGLDNYGIVATDYAWDVCNVCIELPRWMKMGRLENPLHGVYRLANTPPSLVESYVVGVMTVGPSAFVEMYNTRVANRL